MAPLRPRGALLTTSFGAEEAAQDEPERGRPTSRTTTAEICRAAGMSAGNLFHYFPNNRAIFLAFFENDGDDKAERLAQAPAADARGAWHTGARTDTRVRAPACGHPCGMPAARSRRWTVS
ncbi:helix-turn-helix domain-containing protein [Streptomyces mooreae]|uniref:helix-turn-helix domain-containing protein n=1 Tax=Streptomyces mooreae TaxID=3075523 RepID=UPI00374E07B5